MSINEYRQHLLAAIRDLNDAEDEFAEMRYLIAANLAYANKCAADIDPDPRTVAGLLSLPIHQLAYLSGLTGESRWRVHADELNELRFELGNQREATAGN